MAETKDAKKTKMEIYMAKGYPYPYYSVGTMEAFVLDESVASATDIFIGLKGKADEKTQSFVISKANFEEFVKKGSVLLGIK